MANLLAIFGIEKCGGNGAIPAGQNGLDEGIFFTLLFAVVGEDRLVAGQEAAHEDAVAVAILVEADADNFEALGSVLLGEFVEHGVFVAARLAPSGPEGDDEGFAFVLLENLLVALSVDQFEIFGGGGLGRGQGCQC